jgi:hypothetical protein
MTGRERAAFTSRRSRVLPPDQRGPSPFLIGVVIFAIALAVLKPWGGADGPGTNRRVVPPRPTPSPRATTAAEAEEAIVAETCLSSTGWRIATVERWGDRTIRSWRAAEPVTASGPTDPAILPVPTAARAVLALGYCAPVSGDRPAESATVAVWRLRPDTGAERLYGLSRFAPPVASSLGALWVPPGERLGSRGRREPGLAWPPGTYVIRVGPAEGGSGGRDGDERWLAAEILESAG